VGDGRNMLYKIRDKMKQVMLSKIKTERKERRRRAIKGGISITICRRGKEKTQLRHKESVRKRHQALVEGD
jgi:hypothetical protein